MIWNPSQECMSRDQRIASQSRRLRELVDRVYNGVPFYRDKMQRLGIVPEDIRSLEDLARLPFTTKDDLRENYPFGLFAVPMDQIVRVHASSGTTGRATVVGYTRKDIGIWSEVVARTLISAGATPHDLIQVAYGYGLFTGGLGLHYGAEKIGAAVIPVSGGNTKRQIQLMRDFGTTVLACTPSYALHLAEAIAEEKVDRSTLKLRVGVFGAEPWTEAMRREIQERLGITAIDIYGLSEIIGPGVASECAERNGLHIQEDHFVAEIIDAETGVACASGQRGELVFTTVTKVNFDPADIDAMILKIKAETAKFGCKSAYKGSELFSGDQDIVSLRSTLLIGLRGMAAYAWHAYVLGKEDKSVSGTRS